MTKNKKKILIIEDDKDINRTLCLRLQMDGLEVIAAHEGYEGFYKAITQQPDLIILDLKLPGLQGEEICKAIRKDEKYVSLPIIMLTAKDRECDKVIGKVIGADQYMAKPFDMDELLEKIHLLLKVK
ncbi:MAG: response regulator [Candidatus Omnitrophota bacterium]|nr:response regulator [Candidatus Omnitrophota bacterium]